MNCIVKDVNMLVMLQHREKIVVASLACKTRWNIRTSTHCRVHETCHTIHQSYIYSKFCFYFFFVCWISFYYLYESLNLLQLLKIFSLSLGVWGTLQRAPKRPVSRIWGTPGAPQIHAFGARACPKRVPQPLLLPKLRNVTSQIKLSNTAISIVCL